MASYLSTGHVNALLDFVLGGGSYTPATTLTIKLFTTLPDAEDAGGVEVTTGVGYSAVSLTNNNVSWAAAATRSKSTAVEMNFGTATGSWGTVVGGAIYNGGALIGAGTFAASRTPTVGQSFVVPVGGLTISITGTCMSVYLANKLLDLVFGGTSFTPSATLYFSFYTTLPGVDGTGGVEPTGGNYSRKSVTNNATNFPATSAGVKQLGQTVAMDTPNADWGNCAGLGLIDAGTNGNLYFVDATTGTPPYVAASSVVIITEFTLTWS